MEKANEGLGCFPPMGKGQEASHNVLSMKAGFLPTILDSENAPTETTVRPRLRKRSNSLTVNATAPTLRCLRRVFCFLRLVHLWPRPSPLGSSQRDGVSEWLHGPSAPAVRAGPHRDRPGEPSSARFGRFMGCAAVPKKRPFDF